HSFPIFCTIDKQVSVRGGTDLVSAERTQAKHVLTPILLDEPLSHLESASRYEALHQIRRLLKKHGASAIYLTRHSREAIVIADRIAAMRHGHIAPCRWLLNV